LPLRLSATRYQPSGLSPWRDAGHGLSPVSLPARPIYLPTLRNAVPGCPLASSRHGGQQQRCAIGRALVKNPGLLLCDEPTGALDYETSKEVLTLIEEVNRAYGCTVIIVTHNDAIGRMAHRILRLRDGAIAENTLNAHPVPALNLEW
jgi:ABC-type arginine transport system ATPase subunit